MPRFPPCCWMTVVIFLYLAWLPGTLPAQQTPRAPQLPYDLARVKHIESFLGSPRAKDLLSRQGFAVTEEQFRQIFEPYLPATGARMPAFITVDSAWHTYHVLLEEGVQQVELGQARLLEHFSERLYRIAAARQGPSRAVYHDLALFAAVGWAAQDSTCLECLPADERASVAQTLKSTKTGGSALFFELPLQPENFRPVGFYTKTPELARYFVARRWYATSAFRLKSESETLRALYLALLVESDAELKRLHRQLTASTETMVGPADDPGIVEYAQLASQIAKGLPDEEKLPQILADFRREAKRIPGPRVNDQFLLPHQFAVRQEETKGMRLFGPCQLPSAILFQETTDPVVPNRILPSGVDVFAAGPLACDAGRRALRSVEPNAATCEAICRADCGPMPDSLHGLAKQLLHLIHEPLPDTAPMALRTPAWQDKQLWTALGAWAEERHTWVLHAKATGAAGCMLEESPGYVSPYPKFYRQLGQLARRAAGVLAQVTAEPDFAATGREWLKARRPPAQKTSTGEDSTPDGPYPEPESGMDTADRMAGAMAEYFQTLGKDVQAASVLDRARAWEALDAVATRCAEGNTVTESDRGCMRAFLRSPEGNALQLLPEFAALCDRLASIAEKELAGQLLDRSEIQLIHGYGETLARFHFYEGGTWGSPRDDFSCVAPVFNNPLYGTSLYVGVSRPEAIYVILFNGKRLVLHRGAVLSYREFPRPSSEELDDRRWQQEVGASGAPAPPAWTTSFRWTPSKQEKGAILQETAARLREGALDPENCPLAGHEITEALVDRLIKKWQALEKPPSSMEKGSKPQDTARKTTRDDEEARSEEEEQCSALLRMALRQAVDDDVPILLDKLLPATPEEDISWVFERLFDLNWRPHRQKLMTLVHHSNHTIAGWAASLLGSETEGIDVAALARQYDQQPPYVRAKYCYLLGCSPQPTPEAVRVLERALRDPSADIRCEAALAVGRCGATSDKILAEVRRGLQEEDTDVAAAMVYAATDLGLADTAPQMFARLQKLMEGSQLCEPLTAQLIQGLGEFKHQPAKDVLRAFVFPASPSLAKYKFGAAAFRGLLRVEPQNKKQLLSEIFQNPKSPGYMIDSAIREVEETGDIHYVETMLPLLSDIGRTAGQGRQNIAVWAVSQTKGIMEHADPRDPEASKVFTEIRDALLKQTHGAAAADALEALQCLDPATAVGECLSVALDKKVDPNARARALNLLQKAHKPWPIRELLPLLDEGSEPAARTIGALSRKLDPTKVAEAETLRLVQRIFNEMLKGPRGAVAVEGLISMAKDDQDPLLAIACNRSLPYATRVCALSRMSGGLEEAKQLVPLLSDNARPNDQEPTIALWAANTIARLVRQEPYGFDQSPDEFIAKARAWAERER